MSAKVYWFAKVAAQCFLQFPLRDKLRNVFASGRYALKRGEIDHSVSCFHPLTRLDASSQHALSVKREAHKPSG
ncbi:hypothetical protein [Polaromonas sp.]|uniref:hypothetical protein n=1 Tax=Polaromonas sp. TaxID=1869339 RepID=UPI003BAA5F3C